MVTPGSPVDVAVYNAIAVAVVLAWVEDAYVRISLHHSLDGQITIECDDRGRMDAVHGRQPLGR